MAVEFSILDKNQVILIEIDGALDATQMHEMRRQTSDWASETGIRDFVFDLRQLESLENGDPGAIVDLGNNFKQHNFSVWSNTAVLMPIDERAFEQVELLLEIERNGGRGVLDYVESMEEAFAWFEEMANRVGAPKASGQPVPFR